MAYINGRAAFPPDERGKALGINGMAVAVGLAMGPSLGGLLVDIADWWLVFFVNIPIGIVAYLWCLKVLPDPRSEVRQKFDWQGALLVFTGLFALLFFVSRGQAAGWSWPILLLGLLSLIILGRFFFVEKSVSEPMLDLSMFLNRLLA